MSLKNFLLKIINKRLYEIKQSKIFKLFLYINNLVRLKLYFKKVDTILLSSNYKRVTGEGWVILKYQRICNPKEVPFSISENSYVTEETFKKHCEWLNKEADVIPLNQLIDHLENGTEIPPRSVILTFENGFLDQFIRGANTLLEYSLPATFSLPTNYIGSNSFLLYDLLAVLLNTMNEHKIPYPSLEHISNGLDNIFDETLTKDKLPTVKTHQALIPVFYGLSKEQKNKLVEVFEKLVNEHYLEIPNWRDFMSWKEVEKLAEANFQIISQLNSNPWITLLSEKEIKKEISESEESLSPMKTFRKDIISIPYGVFSETSLKNLSQSGFSYALVDNLGPLIAEQNSKLKTLCRLVMSESTSHTRELFLSRIWGAS